MSAIDAGPAWSAWTRVTPVIAAPAPRERYVRIVLPPSISPGADGTYADVRIVDSKGEVSYALDPERAESSKRSIALIDTGFVAHRGTQGVADVGTSGALVDALELEVDTAQKPTYFVRVAIDASDDRKTWRLIRQDAIVYRVAQDSGRGSDTVTFPPTRSRWLRIRVLDPGAAFPLSGVRLASGASREPSLVKLPFAPQPTKATNVNDQAWTFSPPAPVRPTAVAFADGGALYERSVTIEAGDDGTQWIQIAEAPISRFAEGGAQTNVALEERTSRFVRVTVHNGNDAPIGLLRPTLLARPHALVFAPRAGPYRLLSGNTNANAPRYDLSARLAHETWRAQSLAAGESVENAGYRDPRPIGERFPWLITAALIAVAVMLGALALRVVRPARAS